MIKKINLFTLQDIAQFFIQIKNFIIGKTETHRSYDNYNTVADDRLRSYPKSDLYSSSIEANISGTINDISSPRGNSKKAVPVPIKEARILNSTTPKSSPVQKSYVPPKTPIVPSNPFGADDYDESKNPFAEDKDDDTTNPFKDNDDTNPFKNNDDDDYNKNLNPFGR